MAGIRADITRYRAETLADGVSQRVNFFSDFPYMRFMRF
jgi:hypothetical protein